MLSTLVFIATMPACLLSLLTFTSAYGARAARLEQAVLEENQYLASENRALPLSFLWDRPPLPIHHERGSAQDVTC